MYPYNRMKSKSVVGTRRKESSVGEWFLSVAIMSLLCVLAGVYDDRP